MMNLLLVWERELPLFAEVHDFFDDLVVIAVADLVIVDFAFGDELAAGDLGVLLVGTEDLCFDDEF